LLGEEVTAMPDTKSITGGQAGADTASPQHTRAFANPTPPKPIGPKRERFVGFARDEASASMLHDALAAYLPNNNHIHVVDFRACLALLASMTTPETILVDLSGEDQPINAMLELAEVVETGTTVLAIGDIKSLNFYRTVTKGMGIREYLAKPLSLKDIERNFLPIIGKMDQDGMGLRGGRMVAIAGARGGVGTSTITTNLAWYIATETHRHTALLDGELHTGTVALNMNLPCTAGLGTALESPERVDHLFLERSMVQAAERLHILAGQETFDHNVDYRHGSAGMLTQALRARYNFVVADAGARSSPFARDLMFIAQQRIIVLDPSMISIRNLDRILTLPSGPSQAQRPLLVLNHAGAPGGLSQTYMEQVTGLKFDAVIPDLPRIVAKTTQFGTQAASLRGAFRNGIAKLANALGAADISDAA